MSSKTIMCIQCGVYNKDREFCSECGAILDYKKRRELAFKKEEEARLERRRIEKENNPSFFDKYGDHRFLVVRIFVKIIKSIYVLIVAIGGFIAWLIATIAA
ncbi:hypothetical protein [Lacinutrix salivirga]